MSDYIRDIRAKIGTGLLLIPVVAAIIRDNHGRVLLQRRSDNNQWGLPGGMIDPGETPAQAVVRETREETGLLVQPTRLAGVYGGLGARYTYPNGDTIEPTILLFECMTIGGALECVDGESLELQYFDPADIDRISGFHELDFLELTANPFQWDDE